MSTVTDRKFDFTVWGAGVPGRGVYRYGQKTKRNSLQCVIHMFR